MNMLMTTLSALMLSGALTAQAENEKPFIRTILADVPKDSYNLPSACSFRKFYPTHMDHLVSVVFPRVEKEVDDLLKPHTLNGRSFSVTEAVSYADLYHFHLRFPSTPQSFSETAIADPNTYYLLYHSYEHLDLMLLEWLNGIDQMNIPDIKQWVKDRFAQMSLSSGSSGASEHSTAVLPPEELPLAKLENIAAQWDIFLGKKSPGTYRLLLRLKILNNKLRETAAIAELLENRNVASFPDQYEILRFASLPNSWQPATVYFDKIENNPKIAAELRAFTAKTGRTWLSNPEGKTAIYLNLSKDLQAQSLEAVHNIQGLAKKNLNTQNIFKKTILSPKDFISGFAMTDKYIFAVSHSISDTDCPE